MSRAAFHPQAYLLKKRNIKTGLLARTKVLNALEGGGKTARDIVIKQKISYGSVLHHLRLLEAEHLVERIGEKKPFEWKRTSFGQQRLTL